MSSRSNLKKYLPDLLENWPLAQETNFGLGGPAHYFLRVQTIPDLLATLQVAREHKLKTLVLGSGTNVVVHDRGFSGLVIKFEDLNPSPKAISLSDGLVITPAGLLLATVIAFSLRRHLSGLEKLTAIPGTVGGAIVGNAGAYGQAISDHLVWVEIFDGHKIRQVKKTALQFSYRDSLFKRRPDWLVLRAAWALPAGERKLLQAESRKIRTIRLGKYPSGILCAGSFFKNLPVSKVPKKVLKTIPPEKIVNGKIPAGYLLEQVHSGQMSVGGMAVASFHNNFLINTGFGTYYDLRRLANRLKTKVRKRFGLELEEEIRYIA